MREQLLALVFVLAALALPLQAQTSPSAADQDSSSTPAAQNAPAASPQPQTEETASLGTAASSSPDSAPPAAAASSAAPAAASSASSSSSAPAPASPAQAGPFAFATAAYDHGFYLSTGDGLYSIRLNGLFQPRFTSFTPSSSAVALGSASGTMNDFDLFLGRLALSGTAFAPSINYFVQFQVSTSGNTITATAIDWFITKKFSHEATLAFGRTWTPFSYENYLNPGDYLFADFSSAEYAFALSRVVGLELYGGADEWPGDTGRFGYSLMIANSVPALDAPGQENFNSKLSYVGHVEINILAPYGYQESDPTPGGAPKPELTLWMSGAYNPVDTPSMFSNWTTGDETGNATANLNLRIKYFTQQTTGFYRYTYGNPAHPNFNSWGYTEQAGYYVIPGHLELVGRVDGVNWGAPDNLTVLLGSTVNTWYSGPSFPFHRVTEHSAGFNYYFYGQSLKLQADYAYLTGNTFSHAGYQGSRVRGQLQLMF